ncbi:efflux RND transporter periplasmic adaptor subunit [Oleomonas cavernae]|uniref:Efflux RND transporter periplasmic adaptor subunit n=1 Tax=Oleomonas cavernae TaxID=2320859 RepID=A0A418VTQ2_9PROT|nr:efflux RND transporter periplasmic adaptor subunit [Oleomonas cavernae]RJF80527.1 efflux RND transporter periplasmic adaptor subunit [Oleomonas cavernae]
MSNPSKRRWWLAGLALTVTVAGAALAVQASQESGQAPQAAAPAPQALPVSVAVVEQRQVITWDEFSGRLEAIDRVEIRSRVAGVVQSVHFKEGALVAAGDLLYTIDPAPYAAEVERAQAQVAAAQARLSLAARDLDRAKGLTLSQSITQRDLDTRVNARSEAEANLNAAKAVLRDAQLSLGYTQVRAPVAGRVGRLEITVGNLIAAGAATPLLTTLVSVNPIYASFNVDEQVVARALGTLPAGDDPRNHLDQIPVEMGTATSDGTPYKGHLQLVDNTVDASSGTIRVRAIFDNVDGRLMPGQFARLRLGRAVPQPALVVSERAVGTNQDKKFVFVVGADDKVEYRDVTLGAVADGLRIVTSGLTPGERVVVNGLQRVRPGDLVDPQLAAMNPQTRAGEYAQR